ncbi:MAG: hypothetical protein IKO42_07185 [Opitutales bacterium]|nr:hypothetical protein [Opitutales bacterium]
MKNLLAAIAFSIFAMAGIAPLCAQQAGGGDDAAALKSEIAALKQKVSELEADYYKALAESMQRQNKLRAEIRRLKDELEKAKELPKIELPAEAASAAAPALPAAAASSGAPAKETFDKENEYFQARRRMESRRESEEGIPEKTLPDAENKQAEAKPEKQSEKEGEKQGGSSFWNKAFPF